MRKILKILNKEKKVTGLGEPYLLITVLLDDGTEATTIDQSFVVGDSVQAFFDPVHNRIKIKRIES